MKTPKESPTLQDQHNTQLKKISEELSRELDFIIKKYEEHKTGITLYELKRIIYGDSKIPIWDMSWQ